MGEPAVCVTIAAAIAETNARGAQLRYARTQLGRAMRAQILMVLMKESELW